MKMQIKKETEVREGSARDNNIVISIVIVVVVVVEPIVIGLDGTGASLLLPRPILTHHR